MSLDPFGLQLVKEATQKRDLVDLDSIGNERLLRWIALSVCDFCIGAVLIEVRMPVPALLISVVGAEGNL